MHPLEFQVILEQFIFFFRYPHSCPKNSIDLTIHWVLLHLYTNTMESVSQNFISQGFIILFYHIIFVSLNFVLTNKLVLFFFILGSHRSLFVFFMKFFLKLIPQICEFVRFSSFFFVYSMYWSLFDVIIVRN